MSALQETKIRFLNRKIARYRTEVRRLQTSLAAKIRELEEARTRESELLQSMEKLKKELAAANRKLKKTTPQETNE